VSTDVRSLLGSLGISPGPAAALRSYLAPDRLLGDALSLPETVRLSAELGKLGATASPDESAEIEALHAEASAQNRERLKAIRARIDASYKGAFAGKRALPDARRMFERWTAVNAAEDSADSSAGVAVAIEQAGRNAARAAERRKRVCLEWAAAYGDLFSDVLAAMQRDVERRKQEVRSELADHLPSAQALLGIDSVLEPVITQKLLLRHQALVRALQRSCGARFELVLRGLPAELSEAAFEPLLAVRGTAGRLLQTSRLLVHGLLDLEWAAVQGLVDAACGVDPRKGGRL
jgi:hypothetical protein